MMAAVLRLLTAAHGTRLLCRNVRDQGGNIAGQAASTTACKRMQPSWSVCGPDLIFCSGAPTLVALRKYTHEIPIVFAFVSDPVGMGQIDTLARPGGNATGFTPLLPLSAANESNC